MAALSLLLLTAPGAHAGPIVRSADPHARQLFMDALKRVESGQPDLPDGAALQQYLLHDYLVAARLKRDLQRTPDDALDARIAAFLDAHADQPVSRVLRREWFLSLASRGRWEMFLTRTAPSGPGLVDAVIQCWRFAGRLATGDKAGLIQDMLERWREPRVQPPECAAPYAWLRQQGVITPELAQGRTRAALAEGNWRVANESVEDVTAPANAPLLLWIRLLQSPKDDLQTLARDAKRPVELQALVAGFARFAVQDNTAAGALLPALLARDDLTAEARGELKRAAALGAAYSRLPGALDAFDKVPAGQIDGAVQEWRVRAALWAGRFDRALSWLQGMPGDLAAQPRWRYWRARALEQEAGMEAAAPAYAELAGLRDYYGYLAADRLHRPYSMDAKTLDVDAGTQRILEARPGMLRAHALFDCNLTDEAAAEWTFALAGADASVRVQAGIMAHRWGWYAQSIATLAQQGKWDDVALRYPRPFAGEVMRASLRASVPADWIYSIIRQESLYRIDAVSTAGARGLMQVMPGTASMLAKRWKIPYSDPDALFDPAKAILLGSMHLRDLLDRYQGSLPLSLAAYNAGPVPVARWRPARTLDADVWIENIPYVETRTYVQRALEHVVAFAWVRHAQLPRLERLMPAVQPLQ